MRRALIFITFRDWRNHKLRTVITLVSIMVGVSTYFAIRTANQTLLHSLEGTVDRLAGKSTLQITAGDYGFPEDAIELVRSTPGVTDATGLVQLICDTDLRENSRLLVLGVDLEGEQKMRGYELGDAELLTLPATIVISSGFAEQEGLVPGLDRLPILTSEGKADLAILAAFKDESIGALFGGRVGVMDIHSAQDVFGRGRNIDRIDVITEPGLAIDTVRQALKERLGGELDIERPQSRVHEVEDATRSMRRAFLLTSLVVLLVSSFLIYNAMSIAVNQRWKEIGVLRALGVERAKVRSMFLFDAALIGLIGSVSGLAGGYYLALASNRLTGSLANVLSSSLIAVVVPERPRFNTTFAIESIAIGIVVTIISAWLPARAASRLNPALALHNIETRHRERVVGWPGLAFGAGLVLSGFVLTRFTTPRLGLLFQMSYVALIFFGFIVMLPRLSYWIALALRPIADRIFGPEGLLAIDSMTRAPRRTAATVGALMAGLAFLFSTWATIQSSKEVVTRSFERQINYDLGVWGSLPINEELGPAIGSIAGIRHVDLVVTDTTRYREQRAGLMASDMALWFERAENSLLQGDFDRARELVPKGEGVLISDVFAARWGLRVGDSLALAAPAAILEKPVLGVVDYKAWFEGTVYLDRRLYKEFWRNNKVQWLSIELDPGADPVSVKSEVERVTSGKQLLVVKTAAELKEQGAESVTASIDQLFSFFYVQMFIATFVAIIGIVNTLVISVWDRKREIAIIRAVGGTRRQIGRMVLLEATVIGIVGLLVGIAKGMFDTYFMAHTASGVFGGYSLPYSFPGALILLSVPFVTTISLAAAWWPARLAANANVVAGIGSE
jgi:putative ABC transport system permease protein